MKKSTLALSIAAAIGGLGMAGNALAVTDFNTVSTAADATGMLVRNDGGIGHQLVFPYFTAQGANATLLSITNTDTTNGKLVKVRFRGAANSDDLYDFQVALSPGDIWTAAVTRDATSGAASLSTTDKSCTLPASVNGTFNLQRVDGNAAAQTLEGYVEVINMANIPPVGTQTATSTLTAAQVLANVQATALFTAIKHVSGVAPCTSAVLVDKLGRDNTAANLLTATADGSNAVGLALPTTGLTGDWIILNQASTAAWSGAATALEVRRSTEGVASATPTTGELTFWPQISGVPAQVTAGTATAAPVFAGTNYMTADPLLTSGVVTIQNFDLPDLSTAYGGLSTSAIDQANRTTSQLAATSFANQYVTDTAIAAVTDILFSQPTRRYHAAVNYKANSTPTATPGVSTSYPFATTGTTAVAIYQNHTAAGSTSSPTGNLTVPTTNVGAVGTGTDYYATRNLTIPTAGRNLCLNSIAAPARNTIFDREETTPSASSTTPSFVISPATTTTTPTVSVCGETAVISINNGGTTGASALSASIARSDFTSASLTTYNSGWVRFATPSVGTPTYGPAGLPVIGQSFIRVANGAVNYGIGYSNKVTR